MQLFRPIQKISGDDLEKIPVYNPSLISFSKKQIGDIVEFIYESEVLQGEIAKLLDNDKSIVNTSQGFFAILNNRFLASVEKAKYEGNKISAKKIKEEFAREEEAEAEEESQAMWEQAIAQEQPDLNLATADTNIVYPFTPSKYQQKILEGLMTRHQQLGGLGSQLKNMAIEALAGCAKSSTMVLIAVFLKHNSYKAAHCRFVVFGKANQEDLHRKIEQATQKPSWGKTVQTLHSFAFEIWRDKDNVGDYDISDNKYEVIAKDLGAIAKGSKPGELDAQDSSGNFICEPGEFLELLEKLRIYCVKEVNANAVLAIAQRCRIESLITEDLAVLEKVADWSNRVFEEGIKLALESKKIDYTDMLWLFWKEQDKFGKLIDKWRAKLKFVGVDESQDLNYLQIEVLKILHNPQTNFFCFVGDRWQSIYGFRGSESNCMDIIQSEFSCDRFELPLNFRCGTKHLEFVRQLFPQIKIQARPDAPPGKIRCIRESNLASFLKQEKQPTFGIARKNASLVSLAIRLALKGVPVKFKENLVARKIFNLVRGVVSRSRHAYNPESFPQLLQSDTKAKLEKLPEKNRAILEAEIRDLEKCCLLVLKEYQINSLMGWEDVLAKLFENQNTDIEFHTIHTGKGGEGDRVLFIYPDDTPLIYLGQTDEEKQQERNAIYIALTRCVAKSDRPESGTLWLVIQEVIEKGKLTYKWPGWLPNEMRNFN